MSSVKLIAQKKKKRTKYVAKDYEDIYNCFDNKNSLINLRFTLKIKLAELMYLKNLRRKIKKKEFSSVLVESWEKLNKDPNCLWGHLLSALAKFRSTKYGGELSVFLSNVVLINPNCNTAWQGLLKCFLNDIYLESVIFDTVYSGLLFTERNLEKWTKIVDFLLGHCSKDFSIPRDPFTLLAPFLDANDEAKVAVVSSALSKFLFEWLEKSPQPVRAHYTYEDIYSIAFAVFEKKLMNLIESNSSEDAIILLRKSLLFFLSVHDYFHFNNFLLNVLSNRRQCGDPFNRPRVARFLTTTSVANLNLSQGLMQGVAFDYYNIFSKFFRFRSSQRSLCALEMSFGEFNRCANFPARVKRRKYKWKLPLLSTWACIKTHDYEHAWNKLMNCSRYAKRRKFSISKGRKLSVVTVWVYLLSHGFNFCMWNLGILLSLKIMKKIGYNLELIYYLCIGLSAVQEEDLVNYFCMKLLKYGALNEIILLKSLNHPSVDTSLMLLKEVNDFVAAQHMAAAFSYKCQKSVLKAFCKASVLVQHSNILLEWLGIYFFEKGDLSKARLFFEAALYSNPYSWTSVNFFAAIMEKKKDTNACKFFLDIYRLSNHNKHKFTGLMAYKAAYFFENFPEKPYDHFKACENIRHSIKKFPDVRAYREIHAEAYGRYGMCGSSLLCFKELSYARNNLFIYSGSMLAKQAFICGGVKKYVKCCRKLFNAGGYDNFLWLFRSSHAYLSRSIKLGYKKKYHLAQLYSQQALLFCLRAINIFPNYSVLWKVLGDIFFQCASLRESAAYLIVPFWLVSGASTSQQIIVRRYQALILAIRCYYAGIKLKNGSKRMVASLWCSVALSLRKLKSISSPDDQKIIAKWGMTCCANALENDLQDALSWNTYGVFIQEKVNRSSGPLGEACCLAFETGCATKRALGIGLITSRNAGWVHLSLYNLNKSFSMFVPSRGLRPSNDESWFGHIILHFLEGNYELTFQYLIFVYTFTRHRPSLLLLYLLTQLLSPLVSKPYGAKVFYKRFMRREECEQYDLLNTCLRTMIKKHTEDSLSIKLDYISALRVASCLKETNLDLYKFILKELRLLIQRERYAIAYAYLNEKLDNRSSSLSSTKKCQRKLSADNKLPYLRCSNGADFMRMKRIFYLRLAVTSYNNNNKAEAKFYFLKGSQNSSFTTLDDKLAYKN